MADIKIDDLSAAGSVSDSMQLETDIGGVTPNKVTAAQIKTYVQGDIDHGSIDGLTDDDHTQYALADGTRWTDTQTASRAVVTDGSGNLVVSAVTATEIGYVDGVTSAIQTQLDSKYDNDNDIDHGGINGLSDDDHTQYALADGTRWTTTNTANRVPISDGSGNLVVSSTTDTELGYLNNVTSDIQTQIDTKYDADTDVDHDATTNFVADEHIDHTSVTLTAGSGLTGGGDISDNRSFSVDIDGLTEDATPDTANDFLMTYDASAGSLKKVQLDAVGTTTFTGLTDTPSSYSSQAGKILAVNSTPDAIEFIDANTLPVASGSTLPASPTEGEFFLHTPTGRTWLYQYVNSTWSPLRSYGTSYIYVDDSANGSQDLDDGGTTGDRVDLSWILTRLPASIGGDVTLKCAARTWTSSTANELGIPSYNFINSARLYIEGAYTTVYSTLTYSSLSANGDVITFTGTASSAARGDILISTGTEFRDIFPGSLPVKSSSGSTITIAGGIGNTATLSGSMTWTCVTPTTIMTVNDPATFFRVESSNVTFRYLEFDANDEANVQSSLQPLDWRWDGCIWHNGRIRGLHVTAYIGCYFYNGINAILGTVSAVPPNMYFINCLFDPDTGDHANDDLCIEFFFGNNVNVVGCDFVGSAGNNAVKVRKAFVYYSIFGFSNNKPQIRHQTGYYGNYAEYQGLAKHGNVIYSGTGTDSFADTSTYGVVVT